MDLTGIINCNEYYTNHYFTSIFEENASSIINNWKHMAKEKKEQTPWQKLRDCGKKYNLTRDRYINSRDAYIYDLICDMTDLYMEALGFCKENKVLIEVADGIVAPVYTEVRKSNSAPLLWILQCKKEESDDDIMQSVCFEADAEDRTTDIIQLTNDELLSKIFFAGEESPRWVILVGIDQIALIDRNKWNEKRYLKFNLDEIYSRHEETTFQAMAVLLHKENLCPEEGASLLDTLDENSHKHSAGVSDSLKYALRECIELLGNEVIYDMKTRQEIDLDEHTVDAGELTVECLRYMYRMLFMLFVEARYEQLGFTAMKTQTYVKGYSLEGLRDIAEKVREDSDEIGEGYYLDETLGRLFELVYTGYPEDPMVLKELQENPSLHDVFIIEPMKAHIFDPEYTKMITKAKLRNHVMLQIIDLMSISRPNDKKERRGRISYSALGINQMGAVYEALLSYRGFFAEEKLFEVKRARDSFNELDVGYFVPEDQLDNYTEDERVRYSKDDPQGRYKKGDLRSYEKGAFIYRLAGREREKSASYYTPEVLTKCLVKYALKELLKDKTADEILNLTICEPAMGSAAFLNEAINQLAEAYLTKKQEELCETIAYDKRFEKLQQVKMYIADRNVYGVDLNPIAVELAEVSLWLNTIYKGAYVPWFGTQLICGNSLIGARRQVYYTSKLEKGKWYEEAPNRIMPDEKRKRPGVSGRVYHFLLGDPGMANYTDKVIKSLEPDNIKLIKDWKKKFTEKYNENDIQTLISLSETIDKLWDSVVELRKKVKDATGSSLSIYGHQENKKKIRTTIREKDDIYHKIYKSEHMNNAGPYARLKAAMDYWCALWFWPIDKAELLPTRQEFFFDMALILEGCIQTVSTKGAGQLKMNFDDAGGVQYVTKGSQMELDIQAMYSGFGVVNLYDLCTKNERLQIASQVAQEQKFLHWELEFADVFYENGGFDLVLGNPPWVKLTWNEANVLSEYYPTIYIKELKSSDVASNRSQYLANGQVIKQYIKEYQNTLGMLAYMDARSNYAVLEGGQTDLFKCFLPISWMLMNNMGICGYIHPEGVYDEQNASTLREEIFKRLCFHFQFQNENDLFPIAHSKTYSINIYKNDLTREISFYNINNLYTVSTIDECFSVKDEIDYCKKDKNGSWNERGNYRRVVLITKNELKLFAKIYGFKKEIQTRLPVIHMDSFLEILRCFDKDFEMVNEKKYGVFGSEMWHESYAQRDKIIKRHDGEIDYVIECILSGPNIGEANMYSKQPRKNCSSKGDYENIDLQNVVYGNIKLPRVKYIPNDIEVYKRNAPKTPYADFLNCYRLVFRKMLSKSSELNLKCTIIPPQVAYVHSIIGYSFSNETILAYLSGLLSSIVYIYLINSTGKMNFTSKTIEMMPVPNSKYKNSIIVRGLRLNSLNSMYSKLWKELYCDEFTADSWAIDNEMIIDSYSNLSKNWNTDTPIYRDYERYIVFVELDVLAAMTIGMTLEQLKNLYIIQFPNMHENEKNTLYDQKGKIVFTTNKSLAEIGVNKDTWESMKAQKDFKTTDLLGHQKKYYGPFYTTDRIKLYEEVWHNFEERFKDK